MYANSIPTGQRELEILSFVRSACIYKISTNSVNSLNSNEIILKCGKSVNRVQQNAANCFILRPMLRVTDLTAPGPGPGEVLVGRLL